MASTNQSSIEPWTINEMKVRNGFPMSFECGKVLNLGDLKIIPFKAQNPNLTLNAYGQPLPI